MPTNARTMNDRRSESRHSADSGSRATEARRREIMRMLEDIRSDHPTAREIVDAIKRASHGELAPDGVQRIVGSVLALYR